VSSRERQQRAVRARQAAERRAAAVRHRRQWLVTAGSVAGLLLLMAGVFWAFTALTSEDPPAAAGGCGWVEYGESHLDASGQGGGSGGQGGELAAHPSLELMVDVGVPPRDVPRAGSQPMTIQTNLGEVRVEMDLAAAPCAAASFAHLAGQEFYDGTYCHRMFPGMLQCGDPKAVDADYPNVPGIGTGGPSYEFPDENLPTRRNPVYYPAGTVAMANTGAPDTNGSQFFFIYRDLDLDGPNYSVVGRIVAGDEVFAQVDAIGHDAAFEGNAGGGRPNQDIIIQTLRVDDPVLPEPTTPEPTTPDPTTPDPTTPDPTTPDPAG
jgi:peptidyl-prolyl cis-trans isomerase B (cyclophilin B)